MAKVRHRNAEGSPSRWRTFGQLVEAKERFRDYREAPLKPPSGSPEGEGAIRMEKLKLMLIPKLMPKLLHFLKHLEGPGEEEGAVLVIDLDGTVVCQ